MHVLKERVGPECIKGLVEISRVLQAAEYAVAHLVIVLVLLGQNYLKVLSSSGIENSSWADDLISVLRHKAGPNCFYFLLIFLNLNFSDTIPPVKER